MTRTAFNSLSLSLTPTYTILYIYRYYFAELTKTYIITALRECNENAKSNHRKAKIYNIICEKKTPYNNLYRYMGTSNII